MAAQDQRMCSSGGGGGGGGGGENTHDFPLLSIGARNQIWIHFQGDADAHTRGSVGIGD